MGGFYLGTPNESAERRCQIIEAMDRSIRLQGLTPAARIECDGHVLQMFRKRDKSGGYIHRDSRNPQRFAAACGTLVVQGKVGQAALQYWLENISSSTRSDDLLGSYCII